MYCVELLKLGIQIFDDKCNREDLMRYQIFLGKNHFCHTRGSRKLIFVFLFNIEKCVRFTNSKLIVHQENNRKLLVVANFTSHRYGVWCVVTANSWWNCLVSPSAKSSMRVISTIHRKLRFDWGDLVFFPLIH